MANTAPGTYNGFQQLSGTGSSPTYEQVVGTAAYNASAIYYGDPIIYDGSTGYVTIATTTAGTTGVAPIAGIMVGCKYVSVSQKRTVWSNYWPGTDVASTNTVEIYFVNDPLAKWVVWSDATGIAQADVGSTGGFNIGTGNTANGISGAYLNWGTSAPNSDSTGPFRIVGLAPQPPGSNGSEWGAYAKVVVAFNNVATKTLATI